MFGKKQKMVKFLQGRVMRLTEENTVLMSDKQKLQDQIAKLQNPDCQKKEFCRECVHVVKNSSYSIIGCDIKPPCESFKRNISNIELLAQLENIKERTRIEL